MQVEYCKNEHSNNVKYFVSAINTAICDQCHSKFSRDGYECTSIFSMASAYLCDVKALKNKWAMMLESVRSNQAKYTLAFEKLQESIISTFESYIGEVIRVKESIINEANESKHKYLQNIEVNISDQREKINSTVNELEEHISNIDQLIKKTNLNELISLIGSVDISNKSIEIDQLKSIIDSKMVSKSPELPFIIAKKNFSKDELLAQMNIRRIEKHVNFDESVRVPYKNQIQTPEEIVERKDSSSIISKQESKFTYHPILHYIYFSKLFLYDVSAEKKLVIDTPPSEVFPTKNFPTTLIQEFIFFCGGSSNESTNLRTTFTFSLTTLEFIQRKSMNSCRCKHSLALVGSNIIYVIGGVRNKMAIKDCLKYDLEYDKWYNVPSLNDENCLMTSFTFRDHMIYTIGGMSNSLNGFVAAIERIDLSNEKEGWIRVDFRTNGWSARYAMNSCQLSDQYFLLFGGTNVSFQNHCFLYDAETDTLMFISRMQQGAKFENQLTQPILYKDTVYSIDDERNLHMFQIKTNTWSLIRWNQWKPSQIRAPQIQKKKEF